MKFVEKVARTVESAITDSLIELGATTDEVEIEIIEKGSKGFLGFGAKNAKVRVTVKDKVQQEDLLETITAPVKPVVKQEKVKIKEEKLEMPKVEAPKVEVVEENVSSPEHKIQTFLSAILTEMGIQEYKIDTKIKGEKALVSISGEKMGMIIGKRGETLDSLQYLTNIAVNKDKANYVKVMIDTENYRARREETLQKLAQKLAKKASQTKRPVALEPMNPYDRRIIHSALQDSKFVRTHSEGKEPFRKVVITPNNMNRSPKKA